LVEFLETKDTSNLIIRKNLAATKEKMAVQYLLQEQTDEASKLFEEATQIMDKKLPLSNTMIGWMRRGYKVTEKQIRDAQHKHEYFTVRKDSVNPELAIDLPNLNSVPSI